jgi:extracellular solute-binding protein (family 7)
MSLQRLLMASTIALLCIAGSAVAQQYPKMTLRFAHFVPATLPGATVDQWFADELAKRTGGQITMQIFWAESMGKSMELLKMASQGGVDIAATAAGYFPSQIPMLADPFRQVGEAGENGVDQAVRRDPSASGGGAQGRRCALVVASNPDVSPHRSRACPDAGQFEG